MKTEFLITIPGAQQSLRMSTDDIIYILNVKRKSIAWLAEQIQEKRPITSMVLHGHRSSPAIRKKIHDVIARLLAEIPERQRQALLNVA